MRPDSFLFFVNVLQGFDAHSLRVGSQLNKSAGPGRRVPSAAAEKLLPLLYPT